MRILVGLHRFAEKGEGDVKKLQGREELRLRIGDYRIFFASPTVDSFEIRRVLIGGTPTAEALWPQTLSSRFE